jgi:iron complex transport system substrate-binding protein
MSKAFVDPSFLSEARGRRFLARSAALLAAVALLAGCAGQSVATSSPSAPAPTATLPIPSPTNPAPSPAFPAQVTDDEGSAIRIPSEPKRIVTLTAASTETVFALGAGDRLVATDSASDFPAQAKPLPDVGAFGAVDVEKIVGLHADLVIAGGNFDTPADGIVRMRSLGLPVVVVYAATLDAVYDDIELIGAAIGRSPEAAALTRSMRDDIEGLSAAVASMAKPRVFYEVDATREIYGPADRSFLTGMLELAGCTPVTSGSADSYEIPLERLITADPEVIVLGDAAFGVTKEVVAARAGWAAMTAVRKGDIRPVDDKLITRPGPRLPQGLRSLILAIHPDARLP